MVVNDETKSFICRLYDNKLYPSIKAMAKAAGVSTRTFNRVLVATGRATKQMAAQDEARAYLKVLLKHNIWTPKELDKILKDHASGQKSIDFTDPTQGEEFIHQRGSAMERLTKEQVLAYLNAQSVDVLAGLFYASGLVKIAEQYKTSVMNGTLKHQQAARTVKPEQKVSYAPQPGYKQA